MDDEGERGEEIDLEIEEEDDNYKDQKARKKWKQEEFAEEEEKEKKKDEIRFEKQTVERRGGRTLAKNPNDFKGEGHE